MGLGAGSRAIPAWNSPDAQILRERGIAHENAYVGHLRSSGLSVVSLRDHGSDEGAVAETIVAMQSGVDIIVQAAFSECDWFGRADVLRKVARASRLGGWSYEAYDCKLARETIFQFQTIERWGFDPEILFIARKRGLEIREVPVSWAHDARSRISYLRDGMQMLLELATIRWNALTGKYGREVQFFPRVLERE